MFALCFLKFFPACFTLCNGETHSTSNVVPIWSQAGISFEFHKGGGGSRFFLGGGGGGDVEVEDACEMAGCGGACLIGAVGAETQEEVGEGIGTAVMGAGGRGGKGRWNWGSTCRVL